MDQRIEALREWGCAIDSAMERMLDDEVFYLECLAEIPGDSNFERLTEALRARDAATAFDCAHTLKGVLINLGLTPMYQKAVELVEPLRAGKTDGLVAKNEELLAMRDRLARILAMQ